MREKPELLAPAGDLERLKIAVIYGADAVYIGGFDYSLRANANNFSIDDIKEAVKYAHDRGKKVYVTVNMIFHNEDLDGLDDVKEDDKKKEDDKDEELIKDPDRKDEKDESLLPRTSW